MNDANTMSIYSNIDRAILNAILNAPHPDNNINRVCRAK